MEIRHVDVKWKCAVTGSAGSKPKSDVMDARSGSNEGATYTTQFDSIAVAHRQQPAKQVVRLRSNEPAAERWIRNQ